MNATTVNLTDAELKACQSDPTILLAIADWHDIQETLADGMDMGDAARYHRERRYHLKSVAREIQKEFEK